ncbi:hypothetical protein NIES4072_24050 [Nostoc commune NIES-4072]|uniref:Uncharacterized protein n=1 Tax=Nostoc commune NIES-4072 TaxID=2005467 RepID=A0A2R5FJ36_NOSCO|nr:hypothetical protein [Nostoc commune]BBD63939.1 hypothetical protein NIES4070_02810 [Nostoc commune HK-02]GBG18740.1 hypothetical protein NIES4072_24050 [Nostoc commune NIES-4072]
MSEQDNKNEPINELIAVGSEITGGTLVTAIILALGGAAAGPHGAILTSVATPTIVYFLKKLGAEVKNRFLSHREEVRVGATLTFAISKIQENLDNGKQIRQDDFFKKGVQNRSAAEEVFEGVLIASQREHEEKKLRFYGNLVANIAFHPEINRAQANVLLRLGSSLSYTQMCLLGLIVNKDKYKLRQQNYISKDEQGKIQVLNIKLEQTFALQEIYDLYIKRILEINMSGLIFGKPIADLEYITPQNLTIKEIGLQLYNLMELSDIPKEDFDSISQLLSDP